MSAPARATAGVAFRLPPISDLSKAGIQAAHAAWWSAHVDLLRRLLAAQPEAGYHRHAAHLTALQRGEVCISFFSGGPLPAGGLRISREIMEECLADFGPPDHYFGLHYDRPGLIGWWPRLDDNPSVRRSGREVAALIEIERRIAALADVEAELPPEVPGTPALPVTAPAAETPEKRLARLKRALVPLAAVYYDTPPARLPQDVVDVLIDIAEAVGGDMTQAITAWHDACDAVRVE
jgi:hypothetical protein